MNLRTLAPAWQPGVAYAVGQLASYSGVDGIDIDWEHPNACGLQCDASGFSSFKNVMQALRNRFGAGALLTAAITADGELLSAIDAND